MAVDRRPGRSGDPERAAGGAAGTPSHRTPAHRTPVLRTRIAGVAGTAAARASQVAGRGSGIAIAGRVMLKVSPKAVQHLADGRDIVMVTGTNGKTTTTRLLRVALETAGPVASNETGANMLNGVAVALHRNRAARVALEVDEGYVPQVVRATSPKAILLTNLSRDQLDRVAEVSSVSAKLAAAFAALPPDGAVVANCDDPLVVKAALEAPNQVWVRAGQWWTADSMVCPWCGELLDRSTGAWVCHSCGRSRPETSWVIDDDVLHTPDGRTLPIRLNLPGRANRANAGLATAAAAHVGIDPAAALAAMSGVHEVAGRNGYFRFGQHRLRLLLAKNPAGWLELLDMVGTGTEPVIVAVNSRAADSKDVSWIWDVDFERLAGRHVVAVGERSHDLAIRLDTAGLAREAAVPEGGTKPVGGHVEVADTVEQGLAFLPPGEVKVIANYTAMHQTLTWLRAKAEEIDESQAAGAAGGR